MEQLSDEQIQSCILEIETQFYFFLNCIYNVKEKFEMFTNFKDRHIGRTILLDDCARKLESIYSEAYNHLRNFCKAREYVVHGTYEIKYVREKRIIQVSCFSFTLLDASVKKQEKLLRGAVSTLHSRITDRLRTEILQNDTRLTLSTS
jgi:hypothetical protein